MKQCFAAFLNFRLTYFTSLRGKGGPEWYVPYGITRSNCTLVGTVKITVLLLRNVKYVDAYFMLLCCCFAARGTTTRAVFKPSSKVHTSLTRKNPQ